MLGAAEPQTLPDGGALHRKLGLGRTPTATPKSKVDIIDIRHAAVEINLKEEILSQFSPENGPRQLPTLLLYDERGLQLFEDVSCCSPIGSAVNTRGL